MSEAGRPNPKYHRHPTDGWTTDYEGYTFHVRPRLTATTNARWAAYLMDGDTETFAGEGRYRDPAVLRAVDTLDKDDPSKPLRSREQAERWIRKEVFPNASGFEEVYDTGQVDGRIVGWSFRSENDGPPRFGTVAAANRAPAPMLKDSRDDAAQLLLRLAAVPPQFPPPKGARSARGTVPRYAARREVTAALAALSEGFGMPLTQMSDRFNVLNPDTYPVLARGALVLAPEITDRPRVWAMWMEAGHWFRPNDQGTDSTLKMMAERLSNAGFAIESISEARVCALYRVPAPGDERDALYTDLWSFTDRSGTEVALIASGWQEAAMELAMCLPQVRAVVTSQGGITRRRLSMTEASDRNHVGDEAELRTVVHDCAERGHGECSDSPLTDLDPHRHGRLIPAPFNQVEAADGGTTRERRLPTYTKGTRVLSIDGQVHQVWETLWRETGGKLTEYVLTGDGQEIPADRLTGHEATTRRIETPAHRGDTVTERSPILSWAPIPATCPSGHQDMWEAARALDHLRTCPDDQTAEWDEKSEKSALWATAKCFNATGDLTIGLWRMVIREAVIVHADVLAFGRSTVDDKEVPRNSFFGEGRRRLHDRSPEGTGKVEGAARHWARFMRHPNDTYSRDRADRAMRYAAHEFAETFTGGDAKSGSPKRTADEWISAVRYLTELHTLRLLDKEANRGTLAGS